QNAYSVARVTRELPHRSRLGIIGINRTAGDSSTSKNTLVAVDGRLGVGDAVTFDAWAAKSNTPNLVSDDNAYSIRAAYLTQTWSHSARVISTGASFNPEVGFLVRTGGFRYYELLLQRYVRFPGHPSIKDWN